MQNSKQYIPILCDTKSCKDAAAGSSSDLGDSALHDQEMWVVHVELH